MASAARKNLPTGLQPIKIQVNRQLTGTTYALDGDSRRAIQANFPGVHAAPSVFVAAETVDDFVRIHGKIFVVHDDMGDLWPVKVKTATARVRKGEFSAEFYLKEDQPRDASQVDRLVYSLVFYYEQQWVAFLNVPRMALDDATAGMKPNKDHAITPMVRLTATQSLCGPRRADLQRFRDNWNYWPDLRPAAITQLSR